METAGEMGVISELFSLMKILRNSIMLTLTTHHRNGCIHPSLASGFPQGWPREFGFRAYGGYLQDAGHADMLQGILLYD
jgi:hypothetical protein